PKYRGAAPIQHSLLNGDKLTGVSTFFIDSNLDTGPIILQKDIPIEDQDTFDSLSKKMSKEGIGIIFDSLDLVDTVDFKPVPQIEAEISHAPKISNKMYEIDWSASATQINNKIRALSYAGAFTFINGKRIKIFKSKVDLGDNSRLPGEISIVDKTRIIASCGSENLELLEIQIESKRRMRVEQWVNGNQVNDGDLLG
ncbi:MAG: methionyl-tRNA formyltransferase, partial [Candidatus Neomarinimicrobiota bacterium]|nr:methionyl-tRNA formyltransferase [Candidatus Neomarinimicrobiota bacterium]